MNPVLLDLPTGLEDPEKEEAGDVSEEEEEGEGEEEGAIVQDPVDVKEADPKLLKVGEHGHWACFRHVSSLYCACCSSPFPVSYLSC